MKLPSLAALALGLLGVVMVLGSMSENARGAVPVLIKRGIIPGLAGDSALGSSATPTATAPAPGGGATPTPTTPSGPSSIAVRINMVANELSYSGGDAVVPVSVKSLITGPVPSGASLKYLSGAIVDAHPQDTCQWTPGFVKTALDMTASLQTSLFPPKQEVTLSFDGPVWHFDVACPGKNIRVPAFDEESLPKWLTLILSPGNPGPIVVELSAYEGEPKCLHNRGVVRGSDAWGTVTIAVDIVTEPCSPPAP